MTNINIHIMEVQRYTILDASYSEKSKSSEFVSISFMAAALHRCIADEIIHKKLA
jgi:hypothetical protein